MGHLTLDGVSLFAYSGLDEFFCAFLSNRIHRSEAIDLLQNMGETLI
jgi:hypothetical protein